MKDFRFWPILELKIGLPFVTAHTQLLRYNIQNLCREYVVLFIRFFGWTTSIRLYSPERHLK